LQEKVTSWTASISKLIDIYNNFVNEILNPYFRDYYNVNQYPKFLKDKVIITISKELSNALTVNCIIEQLQNLIKINMFNKENIETIFSQITTNIRGKNTVIFDVQDNSNIIDLLHLLDQCYKKDVELSEILRFLIINQMNCIDYDLLFVKKLLYSKYGEIIISEYILCEFGNSIMPSNMNRFIKGLKIEDLTSNENKLDLYYLNYEKDNNNVNFINN
jgi:hypothetical protein